MQLKLNLHSAESGEMFLAELLEPLEISAEREGIVEMTGVGPILNDRGDG
jgi:hypothetical protein